MSEQDTPEVQAPDAGDFDLNAWIDGHHTYPEYTVKVHLDKAAVVASNRLLSDIEKLESDFKKLQEIVEKGTTSGASLGSESDAVKRYKAVGKELKAKKAERAEVLDKAKDSSLKVVLRKPEVHDDENRKGNAFDQVRKELSEKYPEHASVLNSGDQDATRDLFTENIDLANEQQAMMFHLMIASVTNAKGQTIERGPKLTQQVIANMIQRLESSDINKLQLNLNLALSGAELREEQIDAGFPG